MIIYDVFQIRESREKNFVWKSKLQSLQLYRILLMGLFATLTMYGIIIALNFHCSCVNFFNPNSNSTKSNSDTN